MLARKFHVSTGQFLRPKFCWLVPKTSHKFDRTTRSSDDPVLYKISKPKYDSVRAEPAYQHMMKIHSIDFCAVLGLVLFTLTAVAVHCVYVMVGFCKM